MKAIQNISNCHQYIFSHKPHILWLGGIVGLVNLQKWPMYSQTGYKCQILHTDSLGYSKYHVIRPPNPNFFFFDRNTIL